MVGKKVSLALFTASSYVCIRLENRTRVTKPVVLSKSCAGAKANSCSIPNEIQENSF